LNPGGGAWPTLPTSGGPVSAHLEPTAGVVVVVVIVLIVLVLVLLVVVVVVVVVVLDYYW